MLFNSLEFVIFYPIVTYISPIIKFLNTTDLVFFAKLDSFCVAENIKFHDFCKNDTIFGNNIKLFADPVHLHRRGSIIYSKMIAELIKKELKN